MEGAESVMTFDALVTPYAKLERKMQVLKNVMDRHGGKIKVDVLQISDPFKQSGVAQVAAIFELSDGQTVTIFFHNPDVDPRKIQQGDELISWRWMLNKRDITIVIAPERGQDLNIKAVAERIMRLAEKNSPAFIRANSKRAERMQAIEDIKVEIAGLEVELKSALHELEVIKVEAEDRAAFNPISPQGYIKVTADQALQQKHQDTLDKFFKWRINEVKKTLLRMPKWVPDDLNNLFYNLDGDDPLVLSLKPTKIENKVIVVEWSIKKSNEDYSDFKIIYKNNDDLTKTPQQFASTINAAAIRG